MEGQLSVPLGPVRNWFSRLRTNAVGQSAVTVVIVVASLFLALYNLVNYPPTWYDEGSYLHVPKTLVRFGVYADYSSEGFRYYGPTVGVGPTVLLPIAAVFRLFGIGLMQARLVMAAYLLATIYAFYHLARRLGGQRMAWVATALLVSSRGVSLLAYGRQVLGEVPGFFFLITGLGVWFAAWEKARWQQLVLAGVLLGLATVTKYQYLLILAPTMLVIWAVNWMYYRSVAHRVLIVPGVVAVACFVLWQAYTMIYLGPATVSENLRLMRESAALGAFSFSADRAKESIRYLMSTDVYMGILAVILVYGFFLTPSRNKEGLQWGTLFTLVAVNLGWYALASIGWPRYAFPGLAVASLFVARFFSDLTGNFRLDKTSLRKHALNWAILVWLVLMIARPLRQTAREMVSPPPVNASALAMADYLDKHVPPQARIETLEPEMGFFSDHNFHFPPQSVSTKATAHILLGGPPPTEYRDFVLKESPDYILLGMAADWSGLYAEDLLSTRYQLIVTTGPYRLYAATR